MRYQCHPRNDYVIPDIDRNGQMERLEFSSVCFLEKDGFLRVSKNILKKTERVGTGRRKPTKGAMKARPIKAPFCPGGSEPLHKEHGPEKCAHIIKGHASYVDKVRAIHA